MFDHRQEILDPVFQWCGLDPDKPHHRELLLTILAMGVFAPQKRGRKQGSKAKRKWSHERGNELRSDIETVHGFDIYHDRPPSRREVGEVKRSFPKKYSDTTPDAMYRRARRDHNDAIEYWYEEAMAAADVWEDDPAD